MRLGKLAIALLMSCSLSACQTTRTVEALRPDKTNPARFQCEGSPSLASVPPEYKIDWTKVLTVPQAKTEHDAFVERLRVREHIVADNVMGLKGALFACADNMQWQREFYAGLDK